jgi:hypothetical protein
MVSRTTGSQKRSSGRPVVVGVADHNGWAVLVSAAEIDGEPTVVDRRRVNLIEEGVPSQPYHHETLSLSDTESERLLRKVRQSIAACTALAFDRLTSDLSPRYRVASLTIRQPPLDHLPATVAEVHRSYHVLCRADGMLYHSAIGAAASQRDWEVVLHRRGEEVAKAAEALNASPHDVERYVTDLRHTLGPPWTAEYRHAFAAAMARLTKHSQLRALRAVIRETVREGNK